MAKSRGNNAQFTYDFGIAIAQSTVNKVTRLTGATLTLASAFYALHSVSSEYVDTLKENTLRFGGVLSTMKAMEQAQKRLLKGQSYFTVDDQIKGMNQLMAAGVDAKDNIEWINKAAHATGKSFSEFSGMIASAIQGNSQALVDAGLMTQRATRMFDKYEANTIMRQQAILNFVKTHKGLMSAVKNDFETIKDQSLRIKETWRGFWQSVMGKPTDPNSFYGQIVASMRMVATALSQNFETIKRYGYIIGQTLGWVIKQIGHFVVWVGRQVKNALESVWSVTDDFQNQAHSLVVWLEFWKQKVLDFFRNYGDEIKTVLKLLIAYKALKAAFVIGRTAVASVIAYKNAIAGMLLLQKKYLTFMGPLLGNRFTRWLQSLAVFMPRWLRTAWVSIGKFFERTIFGGGFTKFMSKLSGSLFGLKPLFSFLTKGAKMLFGVFKNFPSLIVAIAKAGKALVTALFASNPIGWIALAITLLVTLYNKSETFREFVNNLFRIIYESIKLVWNSLMYVITWVRVGLKKVWNWFKTYIWDPVANFFSSAWDWIGDMWGRFKDSSVGKWINDYIVTPLKAVFQWIVNAWQWVVDGLAKAVDWLTGANNTVSQATKELAEANGISAPPTFEGGDYSSTSYKKPDNFSAPTLTEPATTGNPMLTTPSDGTFGAGGGGNTTNMNFNNGAIQIVVQKGEGIDEQKLSQKIRSVLNDIKRDGDLRGGTV